jgi:putative ABC transport system ATP-binding protein
LATVGEAKILTAEGIGRKADDRWLLHDVSFALRAGDRLALVGPSGSGKTLLLRSLAMLDPLDTGKVCWRGQEVHGCDIPQFRSRVIYLHQRPALREGSVEENLRQPFSLATHRERQFDRRWHVERLATLGRTEAFLSQQQSDLSGGEAQLAALLRVMQLDPDVLLLDEPTAALDTDATAAVEQLLADWTNEQPLQRTTICVTHDPSQARRVANSMLHIRDGRLQEGV